MRLTGGKLNVDVETATSGIFFVPVPDDGTPDTNEDRWIPADLSYLPRNTSKTLEFYIPSTVQTGSEYFIAVRTSYISSTATRKEPVTGFSADTVVVVSG